MNFHIFTFILSPQRLYYEFTQWPAPSWLDSSIGRALHRYCRGHGFEPVQSQLLKLRIWLRWSFTSSFFLPQFKCMNFHISTFITSLQRVYYEFTQWPAPSWLDSWNWKSIAPAIAEVMGLNPVQAWIFFRLSVRNCLSCVYNCDDHSSFIILPQFKCMNFHIFTFKSTIDRF